MSREEQWARHVEAWRSSGESARAYCERRGLKVSSFRYWARRIRERDEQLGGAADAAPVRMAAVRTRPSRDESRATAIRLQIGEVSVEVDGSFDEQALGRLLDLLEARRGAR